MRLQPADHRNARQTTHRVASLAFAAPSCVRTRLRMAAAVVAVTLILVLGWSVADAHAQTFVDVQATDWFYGPVQALASQGAIHGDLDGNFSPYAPATRAEFAYAIAALLHLAPAYNTAFGDVSPEDWFAGAVGALYEAGVVLGSDDGMFLPDCDLARQQAATLMMRAVVYSSSVGSGATAGLLRDEAEVASWLQGFKDRTAIAPIHHWAVANAYRLGAVSGFDDGRFYPFLTVTRGQAAGILYAALSAALSPRPEPPGIVVAEAGYPSARQGTQGPLVSWMERRLAVLSYPPGTIDGVFDARTGEAVMAFQKVEGLDRTGVASAAVWSRLLAAERPASRLAVPGRRVEVDLTRQVLLLTAGNAVEMTVPIASGRLGLRTPAGTFSVERKLPYWRQSALGMLYKPVYFHGGYAIHGSYSVPPEPASHGCVRVSLASMNVLYPLLAIGTRVDVYY